MSLLPIVPQHFITAANNKTSCYFNWNKTVLPKQNDTIESLTELAGNESAAKVVVFLRQGLEAECFLKTFYTSMTISELATYLGCDKNVVVRRAKKLNLGSRNEYRVSGKPYQLESSTISELVEKGCRTKCIAKKLNRTVSGVAKKIQRMKREGTLDRECVQKRCNGCDIS